jgi:hypothetical protein
VDYWQKLKNTGRWLPSYAWQRFSRRLPEVRNLHLIIALADHFEPAIVPRDCGAYASLDVQEQRVERWCREYLKVVRDYPDSDGCPFRHTYFYPAEQYDRGLIERLAEHCHEGWGELEIHLHHGIDAPDTAENTRQQLVAFRDTLAEHGCLCTLDGDARPRYAFVHGNFALANSHQGRFCGVDNEMQVLAETGCYADFTLPSAPNSSQVSKINSIYECALPLDQQAPHRRGRDLKRGRLPERFPIIVQGPLLFEFSGRRRGLPFPRIENGELTGGHPPTLQRLRLWQRASIHVQGRPDWLFIKLHCHGMNPNDHGAMLGALFRKFLADLVELRQQSGCWVHFVTAREMTNIVLAACDGREGDPGAFRDYRLRLIRPVHASHVSAACEVRSATGTTEALR